MSITRTLAVLAFLGFALESYAVSVTIEKPSDAPCGESLGTLVAIPMGGTPPYSFQWSNGATTDYIEFLPPGTYSVTVTDGLGDTAFGSEDILVTSSHAPYQAGFSGLVHCAGDDPYAFLYLEDPHHGPEPHGIQTPGTLFGNFSDIYAPQVFNYIGMWMDTPPGSWVTVDWTDGQGCPGSTFLPFSTEFVQPNVQITSVQGACGGSNGRINITVSGADPMQNFRVNIRTLDGQIPPGQVFQSGSHSVQGNNSFNFSSLAAGAYWIMTDPDIIGTVPNDQGGQLYCVDSMYVEVPDLLGQCAQVSGSVFIDHDQDCVKDANDPGLSYRLIEFLPGSYYAIAGPNGGYSCYLPNGSYTMNVYGTGTELYPVCPAVQPIPIVVSGANQTVNVADSSLVPLDLSTSISAGPARPGFMHNVWMRVSNGSGQASGAIDATLEFDPEMSFVGATPTPTSVVGNTVTWSGLPALTGFDHLDLGVQLQVPPDILLVGSPFTHTFSVAQPLAESDATNNTTVHTGVFTASLDPNDKTVRTSSGLSETTYVINEDEWLDYTINFQNTGNDTAFTVMVRDVLPPELDMGTFEQGLGSHPFDVSFKPGRIVEWRFDNILLPDSGTNEAASHGQVNFRIRPYEPLLAGTVISNEASIFFDYNPPVITAPSVLTAEFSTQVRNSTSSSRQLRVMPNPATDRLRVAVDQGTIARISVMSMDGRTAWSRVTPAGPVVIDVKGFRSGSYVLEAETTDGGVWRSQFIKQ